MLSPGAGSYMVTDNSLRMLGIISNYLDKVRVLGIDAPNILIHMRKN